MSLQSLKKLLLFLLLDLYLYISYWYYFFFSFPTFSQTFLILRRGIYRVLKGLESISDLLILREVLWTLDKDPLRRFCVWTYENQISFCMIVTLLRLTELCPLSRLCQSNSNIFWDHLNLVEGWCTPFIWIHFWSIWWSIAPHSFIQMCKPDQLQIWKLSDDWFGIRYWELPCKNWDVNI